MKVLITIITTSLFFNSRLVLCEIFSHDFPKIRNLPKIFLRRFENVSTDLFPGSIVGWRKKDTKQDFVSFASVCSYVSSLLSGCLGHLCFSWF